MGNGFSSRKKTLSQNETETQHKEDLGPALEGGNSEFRYDPYTGTYVRTRPSKNSKKKSRVNKARTGAPNGRTTSMAPMVYKDQRKVSLTPQNYYNPPMNKSPYGQFAGQGPNPGQPLYNPSPYQPQGGPNPNPYQMPYSPASNPADKFNTDFKTNTPVDHAQAAENKKKFTEIRKKLLKKAKDKSRVLPRSGQSQAAIAAQQAANALRGLQPYTTETEEPAVSTSHYDSTYYVKNKDNLTSKVPIGVMLTTSGGSGGSGQQFTDAGTTAPIGMGGPQASMMIVNMTTVNNMYGLQNARTEIEWDSEFKRGQMVNKPCITNTNHPAGVTTSITEIINGEKFLMIHELSGNSSGGTGLQVMKNGALTTITDFYYFIPKMWGNSTSMTLVDYHALSDDDFKAKIDNYELVPVVFRKKSKYEQAMETHGKAHKAKTQAEKIPVKNYSNLRTKLAVHLPNGYVIYPTRVGMQAYGIGLELLNDNKGILQVKYDVDYKYEKYLGAQVNSILAKFIDMDLPENAGKMPFKWVKSSKGSVVVESLGGIDTQDMGDPESGAVVEGPDDLAAPWDYGPDPAATNTDPITDEYGIPILNECGRAPLVDSKTGDIVFQQDKDGNFLLDENDHFMPYFPTCPEDSSDEDIDGAVCKDSLGKYNYTDKDGKTYEVPEFVAVGLNYGNEVFDACAATEEKLPEPEPVVIQPEPVVQPAPVVYAQPAPIYPTQPVYQPAPVYTQPIRTEYINIPQQPLSIQPVAQAPTWAPQAYNDVHDLNNDGVVTGNEMNLYNAGVRKLDSTYPGYPAYY